VVNGLARHVDLALVDPPCQQAEGGELLQGDLLSQDETVFMRGRIPDALEAPSADLNSAVQAAAPGLGVAVARKRSRD
jgi:hypothetical protein